MASGIDEEELRVYEEWFAARDYFLELELATGGGVVEASWMAIVRHADGRPAYITGYGPTKVDAARSACHRLLRLVPES